MSLIRKTDVKNHLSARRRTEIHLQPAIQEDATGFPYEEPAGADPSESDSTENPRNLSPFRARKATAIALPKSVRD